MFVAGSQRHRFQNHDEQRQPHGELRKQVMEGYGVSKMQAMNE